MRNRKVIVTAFLLVAVLILGVGYAAVTDILDITGTSEVSQAGAEKAFNEDIYFDGVKNAEGSFVESYVGTGYSARVNADNNDKASFTVTGLEGAGDSVTITYRVVNKGDLDAVVSVKSSTNSNDEYFKVEYFVNGSSTALDLTSGTTMGTIAHTDGQMEITVVVTLRKTPTDTQSLTSTFEFVATGVDA